MATSTSGYWPQAAGSGGQRPIPPSSFSMSARIRSACRDRHVSIACASGSTLAGSSIAVRHVGSAARSKHSHDAVAELHVRRFCVATHREVTALEPPIPRPLVRHRSDQLVAPVELPVRGVPPPRRVFAAQERCQRQAVALRRHRHADRVAHGRHQIDVLRERVDDRAVRVDVVRIADDADDVVALLPVPELLAQAVIAEHLAVIRRDDDHRVVPHAELAERVPDPAELVVDLADHPVVLRSHVAHPRLVGGCRRPRIVEHHVVHAVALRGGSDRQRHVGRVVRGGPLPGGRVRRVRSQVAEVREPRRLLAPQPLDRVIGEERRHAVLGRALGLGRQQLHRAGRRVVAERGEPVDPRPVVVGDVEHGVEAGQDAVVRRQPRVVGTVGEHADRATGRCSRTAPGA